MNLKKAVNRFKWRFRQDEKGEFHNFKPTLDDVKAINTILQNINTNNKKIIAKNNLFAKLLVYQYTQNIRHYETTVLNDLNFAQRDLCKVLEHPLESIYKGFYNDLINNQLNKLNKNKEFNKNIDISINKIKKGELEIDNFIIKKYGGLDNYIEYMNSKKITDEEQINIIKSLDKLKETFTFDFVTDKLNEMVVNAYNNFN